MEANALIKHPYVIHPKHIGKRGQLTTRQREIAQLIAMGYTTKQIATYFHIQRRTVQYHLRGAMERMGAVTIPNLVYMLVRWGELPQGSELSPEQIERNREKPYAYVSSVFQNLEQI
jgi:DNA-binding CsgD family transcriptional regulator